MTPVPITGQPRAWLLRKISRAAPLLQDIARAERSRTDAIRKRKRPLALPAGANPDRGFLEYFADYLSTSIKRNDFRVAGINPQDCPPRGKSSTVSAL
jgi:hypothetical protein